MVRLFKHYVPGSLLLIGMIEHLFLIFAIYIALFLRWADAENITVTLKVNLPEAITFASIFTFTMFALGLYNKDHVSALGTVFTRLIFSFLIGFVALALIFFVYPDLAIWRSAIAIAFVIGIIGIMAIRWIYLQVADIETFRRRIVVLGIGRQAAKIEALEQRDRAHGFRVAGFVPMTDREIKISADRNIWGNMSLVDLCKQQGVEEIVVAVDERRGGIPTRALLDCKLAGLSVTDYSTFWERESGKVDLDSLHPSWLIFSDGFPGGWLQAMIKRVFDVLASLTLLIAAAPILVLAAIAVKLTGGAGPVFYRQERVGLNGAPFMLLKFRSMRADAEADGVPRWAAVGDTRITPIGNFMRKTRIDEIPQIFNVLKGEMSFIGPRPERQYFVDQLREAIPYYFERHRVKPGISGWAQLNYPYGASVEDAKEKFQFDLYYIKNYSLFLDLIVLIQTARVVLWPQGVR